MRISAAQPTRDYVIVLEGGDELRAALKDLCLDRNLVAVVVEGAGRASRVTLHGARGATRPIEGPVEVLHLWGTAELRGRALDLEVRVVTGRVGDLNGGLVQDVAFERAVVRCSALDVPIEPHAPVLVPEEPARPEAPGGWAAVALASSAAPKPEEEDQPVRAGDWVDHPVFGRCKVVRVDDEHLRVRRDSGRTIALGTAHLRLTQTGTMSDGKRVYRLEVVKAGR